MKKHQMVGRAQGKKRFILMVVDFGESCIKLVGFDEMIPEEKSTWNMMLGKQHWKGDHSIESQVLSSVHNL